MSYLCVIKCTRTSTHVPPSGLEVKNIGVNAPQLKLLCFNVLVAIDFVCQAKISAFEYRS